MRASISRSIGPCRTSNLPRITGIEAGVVAKVVEVTAPAAAAADPATLPIEYVVPRDQPIELWDADAGDRR